MTRAPSSTTARENDEGVADGAPTRRSSSASRRRRSTSTGSPTTTSPGTTRSSSIDQTDPRWELPGVDKLGGHRLVPSQPPESRARIGLWRVATAMKIGLQFENLLKRGLLNYAYRLPNGSPEFRYVYHETIEEGHHGMMFQEFVNRTKLPIRGMPRPARACSRRSPRGSR